MSGSAEGLENDLREGGGKTAPAQITAAQKSNVAISTASDAAQPAANAQVNWTLTLQVTPDNEAPFGADVEESYSETAGPSVGDTIGVLYDPHDHSRVVVDYASEGLVNRLTAQHSERMQQAMAYVGGESAHDLTKEAIDDPVAFREKMRERANQLNANAMAAAGVGEAPSWMTPAGTAQPDPADEIAKLADLRDRGALTSAEFEAQKKKILGT